MKIEKLPEALLTGEHLHCRPVKGRPVVEAQIVHSEDESQAYKVVIVCPQRGPKSVCELRNRPGVRGPRRCHWYKGDSLGVYKIVGLGMDKKSE